MIDFTISTNGFYILINYTSLTFLWLIDYAILTNGFYIFIPAWPFFINSALWRYMNCMNWHFYFRCNSRCNYNETYFLFIHTILHQHCKIIYKVLSIYREREETNVFLYIHIYYTYIYIHTYIFTYFKHVQFFRTSHKRFDIAPWMHHFIDL